MCVNFTFSSLLSQSECLGSSEVSAHPLLSFSSWSLQTTEWWHGTNDRCGFLLQDQRLREAAGLGSNAN